MILRAAPILEYKKRELALQVSSLKERGINPRLSVFLVGKVEASAIYVRNKKRFCKEIGVDCELKKLEEDISEDEFLDLLEQENDNPLTHGLFVQFPLPPHLAALNVEGKISPEKDVDGLHPLNLGKLLSGQMDGLLPCTPRGIISLFDYYKIALEGKNVCILGRGLIVGRPLASLLMAKHATVTVCHSKTTDLSLHTKEADIVVSAVGKAKFLNETFFCKKRMADQILIDVGINRDQSGKLCGDIDFDGLFNKVAGITPVPGGIGPLTILSLGENLLQASKNFL